jgi:hypothetical protein
MRRKCFPAVVGLVGCWLLLFAGPAPVTAAPAVHQTAAGDELPPYGRAGAWPDLDSGPRLPERAAGTPEQRAARQNAPPAVYLLNGAALAATRAAVRAGTLADDAGIAALRQAADRALQAGPFSVVDKTTPAPSGDPHDYLSVGRYWWPNPASPDGLPWVQRDGETNPATQGAAFDYVALGRLTRSVGALALAYYLTGHEPYAAHAATLVRAWFLDPATRMNPHLRYAQSVPGRPPTRGTGILDGRAFLAIADATALLAGSPAWSAADAAGLQAWCGDLLAWLRESDQGQREARAANNHGTWYAVQAAGLALYSGQDALAHDLVAEAGPRLIASQIEPDGRQPHELARTRAFHYSAFNLEALLALATLGEHVGVDLWRSETGDGRGIRGALDYLLPFAAGAAPWPYPDRDAPTADALALLLALATRADPAGPYAGLLAPWRAGASPLQRLYLDLGVWWTRG